MEKSGASGWSTSLRHYLQSPLSTYMIHTTNYVLPGKISDFNESQLNEYTSTFLYFDFCKIFQKRVKNNIL